MIELLLRILTKIVGFKRETPYCSAVSDMVNSPRILKCNQSGIDLIKKYEGFRDKCYKCPSNFDTIGYGHLILEDEERFLTNNITEDEATNLLKKDIIKAENGIKDNINMSLTDNQFSALVSFTYNVGIANFKRSTLRKVLNNGDYDEVPNQLVKWVYGSKGGKKIKLSGLIKRRKVECELWLALNNPKI